MKPLKSLLFSNESKAFVEPANLRVFAVFFILGEKEDFSNPEYYHFSSGYISIIL